MRQTGRRRLALEEVVDAGRPAVYRRFGDELLFVDGTIFDVSGPGLPTELSLAVPLDHPRLAKHAVGIEFGWQHALHCPCPACSSQTTPMRIPEAATSETADDRLRR